MRLYVSQGHFTHETEGPWSLHFKHSHWWKRLSRSKFTSHYAGGTNGFSECKMDPLVPTWHQMDHLDYFQKSPLGGRQNTEPEDHGTSKPHNCCFIYFFMCEDSAWIETHWSSIWLRARSHMTSHYIWGSMTTLHDFGSVLDGLWTLLLDSHNFMVTSLGSCVEWS